MTSYDFPPEILKLNNWICWRLEKDKKGKDTKVPYSPKTGKKASTINPDDWGSIEDAKAAYEKYRFSGLGFVFEEKNGIYGIDIDHCIADNGNLNDVAETIVSRLKGTFIEVSPSGKGLHALLMGSITITHNKNTSFGTELYNNCRYFTMTGNPFRDAPLTILRDDEILTWLHDNYIKPQGRKKKEKKKIEKRPLTDDEIIERAKETDGFTDLWEGRWKEQFDSQSEADLSLTAKLMFWSGKNIEQVDRLFRQSGLMREKWDKVHHADGSTYGEETIEKAFNYVENGFNQNGVPIFEYEKKYFRLTDQKFYPITNFTLKPVEMLVAKDEAEITVDIVTDTGKPFKRTFATRDFDNSMKFTSVLNTNTLSLTFFGGDGDLKLFKNYISNLKCTEKTGIRAIGIYKHDGRWVYVGDNEAIASDGEKIGNITQLEKYKYISGRIHESDAISTENLQALGRNLLNFNEKIKTVSIISWAAACFVKEHLLTAGIRFPHCFNIGEAGSGKSSVIENIVCPIFGTSEITAASQVTAFSLMREAASSRLIPQIFDEFKPSKMDKYRLFAFYNHLRDSYDGHAGMRGRSDQSITYYDLTAPIIIAGEESASETAIRERAIELLYSKKDLKDENRLKSYIWLNKRHDVLTAFGRSLLDTALKTKPADALTWFKESKSAFSPKMPPRIINNLQCCAAGIRLIDEMCKMRGFSWVDVFGMQIDECYEHLHIGAREYLLDGGENNKSVVELTLENMARMGVDNNNEFKMTKDGNIAFRFNKIYDKYTGWRRNADIRGECLDYREFLKQLKHSDLYIDYSNVRFESGVQKAHVLDYTELKKRCNIEDFSITNIPDVNDD